MNLLQDFQNIIPDEELSLLLFWYTPREVDEIEKQRRKGNFQLPEPETILGKERKQKYDEQHTTDKK